MLMYMNVGVKLFMFSSIACHFLSNVAIILVRKRDLHAQRSKQVRCRIKYLYSYTRKMRVLI